jgi:hypothetical protein
MKLLCRLLSLQLVAAQQSPHTAADCQLLAALYLAQWGPLF